MRRMDRGLRMCPECRQMRILGPGGYCRTCSAERLQRWRRAHPDAWKRIAKRARGIRTIRGRFPAAKRWADAVRDATGDCLFCSRKEHAEDCPAAVFIRAIDDLAALWDGGRR